MKQKTVIATLMRVSIILFLITGLFHINGCGRKEEKQFSEKEMEERLPREAQPQKGAEKMMVNKGDRVKIQYTGSLVDGTIFDRSKEGEPLEFTVGAGQIIPGFEKAVEGMKLGEQKKVTITSEDAYGKRDETLIRDFPRTSLPENFEPEKGMVIGLQDQNGRETRATIIDITENSITVDLNHPLAGMDLIFDIKVVGIE